MRKLFRLIKLGLILTVAYIAAGPYITKSSIKSGIIANDPVKLSKNIDFDLLRQNIKNQLDNQMMENVSSDIKDNPLSIIALGLSSTIADRLADSYVSPKGLSILMTGNVPLKPNLGSNTRPLDNNGELLFKNARTSFDAINQFSIWVPNDRGNEIRFILTRERIKWKLIDIIINVDTKK